MIHVLLLVLAAQSGPDTWSDMTHVRPPDLAIPAAPNPGWNIPHPGTPYTYSLGGGATGNHYWYRYGAVAGTWTSHPYPPTGLPPSNRALMDKLTGWPVRLGTGQSLVAVGPRLYAFGGTGLFKDGTASGGVTFWEFDPSVRTALNTSQDSIGRWTRLVDLPVSVQSLASLAWNGGDSIYAAQGLGGRFFRYSIAGASWTELAALPEDPSAGIAVGPDGCVYAVTWDPLQGFYRYDPATGDWIQSGLKPGGGGGLTVVPGQEVLYYGFFPYSTATHEFLCDLPQPQIVFDKGAGMTGVGDGDSLFAMAGGDRDVLLKYSIQAGTWTAMSPLPEKVNEGASIVTDGRYLYATVGGSSLQFLRYAITGNNPEGQPADSWSPLPDLPPAYTRNIAYAAGSVYLLGGAYDRSKVLTHLRVHRFDTATNSWSDGSSVSSSHPGSRMLYPGSGDRLYVVCRDLHDSREDPPLPLKAYNFVTDSWEDRGNCPNPAYENAALIGLGRDSFYALELGAGGMRRYSMVAEAWSAQSAAPPVGTGHGCSIADPGRGSFLYVLEGSRMRTFWRYQIPNGPPPGLGDLVQKRADGTTPVGDGEVIPETAIVLGTASPLQPDPDGDRLALEIELRRGPDPFEDEGFRDLGLSGAITFGGLERGQVYRWQARVIEGRGGASAWVTFAGGFQVRANTAPAAGGLRQARGGSGLPIATGDGRVQVEEGVLLSGTVEDADNDPVGMEFRVRPVDGGPDILLSSPPAHGGAASVTFRGDEGAYTWEARAIDDLGGVGPWLSFGTGLFDFQLIGGSFNGESCANTAGGGLWLLAFLGVALVIISSGIATPSR